MKGYDHFKSIIALEKYPDLVQFVHTFWGKILLLLVFNLELFLIFRGLIIHFFIVVVTSLITFRPQGRRLYVLIGMLLLLMHFIPISCWDDWNIMRFRETYFYGEHLPNDMGIVLGYVAIFLVFALTALLTVLTIRFSQRKWVAYPTLNLFFILFFLMIMGTQVSLTVTGKFLLWSFILCLAHYFWYIAYTLKECGKFKFMDIIYDYGRYHPIWLFSCNSYVPFPKGPSYLQQIEAKTNAEFAVTQLKAVKLVAWAAFVNVGVLYLSSHHSFDIPDLSEALSDYSKGQHYSCEKTWLCLILNFFKTVLNLTVWGHSIIAICRMCGYRALRNTYNPLVATTLIDFWNRYYYYFKELLVEFFFYPAYFRFFKSKPKLRLFFAVFSAAGLGNIFYHFLYVVGRIEYSGFLKVLYEFKVYACYGLFLGVAIGLSALRNQNKIRETRSFFKKLPSILFVLFFYMLMLPFNETYVSSSMMINFRFLGSLFNIP